MLSDAPRRVPDANLRHQEALDCAKGQRAEAEFPIIPLLCPRSFGRAVMTVMSLVVMAKAVTHKFVISMVEDSLHLDSPLIELKNRR